MEDKVIFLLLSLLVILLGVVSSQFFFIRKLKKTLISLELKSGVKAVRSESNEQNSNNSEKVSKRPQLERITIGETINKQPIYKSSEGFESVEEFYYDDVRTAYHEPEIAMGLAEPTPSMGEKPKKEKKLTGTRFILLFVYMVAGPSLFVSIFYLLAAYLAAKG